MKSLHLFILDFKECQRHNAYLWQKQCEVGVQSEQPQMQSVSTMIFSCPPAVFKLKVLLADNPAMITHREGPSTGKKKGFEGNMEWCF